MRKEQAKRAAQKEADCQGVVMAVTFDPYEEHAGSEEDKFGYMPAQSAKLFRHVETIELIRPQAGATA